VTTVARAFEDVMEAVMKATLGVGDPDPDPISDLGPDPDGRTRRRA